MRHMAAERPPLILSKIHFAGWPYSTLLPGPWAAADGLCWHTSRESHPSEDLSELPPLLDPGITRGCGWTGVSLSDCWRGSDWFKTSRNAKQPATGCFVDGWAPLCTFLGRLWCGFPHRWSWRILQRRFSPPPGGPLVSGRIPLPDILFARIRTKIG